jgi:hypothetical protein
MSRTAALKAGFAYFALVFALGFVLGVLRALVLARHLGETASVLLELPVMLGVSWLACGWALDRFAVPRSWRHRLAMGGVAFALLMLAELGVAMLALDRSPMDHARSYRSWPAGLGLTAQLAFAAFPLLRPKRGQGPALAPSASA